MYQKILIRKKGEDTMRENNNLKEILRYAFLFAILGGLLTTMIIGMIVTGKGKRYVSAGITSQLSDIVSHAMEPASTVEDMRYGGIHNVLRNMLEDANKVPLDEKVDINQPESSTSLSNNNKEDIILQEETLIPVENIKKKIFETEELSAEIQHIAKDLANEYEIPLEILISLIYRESGYQSGVISANGEDHGMCQINISVQPWVEKQVGRDLNFKDDFDSIEAACFILSYYYDKYMPDKNWHYILMCYNGGEPYAQRHYRNGTYSSRYSRAILEKARELGWEED